MIGHQAVVLFGADAGLLLGSQQHFHIGGLDVLHADQALAGLGGVQGRLVEQVGQIRAGKADGALRHLAEVHAGLQRLVAGVHPEDFLPPLDVGVVDRDLPVKAPGPQQRRVQDVGAVGGRHDDDAVVRAEAVHFHQQLVQGLLALVVSAAQSGAPVAADRIDLIDEDDGRGGFARGVEQVAHARGAHADVHLHKIRSRDGVERDPGLPGHGLGQQGFTGTRRAHQQHAVRNARAQLGELRGVFEEFHHLDQLLLFLVGTGHIPEGHLGAVLGLCFDLGAAEGIELAVFAAHAVGRNHPQHNHAPDNQNHGQEAEPHGNFGGGLWLVGGDDACLHLLIDQLAEIVIELAVVAQLIGYDLLAPVFQHLHGDDVFRGDGDLPDLLVLEIAQHVVVGQGILRAAAGIEQGDHRHNEHDGHHIKHDLTDDIALLH